MSDAAIPSYGKVLQLGHFLLEGLFSSEVVIQEKIDGSQFSALFDAHYGWRFRSNGANIDLRDDIPKMFRPAVEHITKFHETVPINTIMRFETLAARGHNSIVYDRVPKGNLVLFDAEFRSAGTGYMADRRQLADIAACIDVDLVPEFFRGQTYVQMDGVPLLEWLERFLTRESLLGGSLVEGIVIKNYNVVGKDGKYLRGKLVRPEFKELNKAVWGEHKSSLVVRLGEELNSEARWQKAVQHMRETGVLQEAVQDIGPLLAAVNGDILEEEGERIKLALFKEYWKPISRAATKGLVEWYKDQLVRKVNEVEQ